MFGLVRRKTHEAELLRVKNIAKEQDHHLHGIINDSLRASMRKQKELETQAEVLLAAQASAKEAWERTRIATLEKQEAEAQSVLAEARRKEAEEACARMQALHVGRARIFVLPMDPLAMTARARAIEGTIRIHWSADERSIICDCERPLSEAEYNAVIAAVIPGPDRT